MILAKTRTFAASPPRSRTGSPADRRPDCEPKARSRTRNQRFLVEGRLLRRFAGLRRGAAANGRRQGCAHGRQTRYPAPHRLPRNSVSIKVGRERPLCGL